MLQAEAAELLRCSIATVKRLRLTRRLGYYRGRPALISQADLELYIASIKIRHIRMPGPPGTYATVPADTRPRPFKLLTVDEAAQQLRRTPATIRIWLRSGKLPYIPGKPKRVDETDLSAFVLCKDYQAGTGPEPPGMADFLQKKHADKVDEIRQRARTYFLKRRMPRILSTAKRYKPQG